MAKYNLSLSSREDLSKKRQVLVRATFGKNFRMRFKSGVWVNPVNFDDEANEIIIPKKGRLNFMERAEATQAKSQLDTYLNRIDKIYSAMSIHMEELTSEFFEKAMQATAEMNASDISYYSITKEIAKREQEKEIMEKLNLDNPVRDIDFFGMMNLYLEKSDFSERRNKAYQVLIRQLCRYQLFVRMTDKKRESFSLNVATIDTETLEDFFDYFRNEKELSEENPKLFNKMLELYPVEAKPIHKGTLAERGHNTFVKTMKMLKAFFVWCNENGITSNNPFKGVKIGTESYGTPFFLTIAERNAIADADLQELWDSLNDEDRKKVHDVAHMGVKRLAIQRDIFVFQCLIGCRVSDLIRLTSENVVDDALQYIPTKTKSEKPNVVEVPLNERAKALAEKYKGVDSKGRLMPFITPQNYNDAIKGLLYLCSIKRNVTTINPTTGEEEQHPIWEVASSHMARRTFIGNLYKKVQDPNLIGSMSGHVEGSKAFVRYRDIDKDIKKNIISLID